MQRDIFRDWNSEEFGVGWDGHSTWRILHGNNCESNVIAGD